jgi:methanogenic corrinoid protein MtbC1
LTKLGWLWEVGEISIAKEHNISYEVSRMIKKYETKNESNNINIVGMTVKGEKHTLGLQMLCTLLDHEGYNTHYIGEAVPDDDLEIYLNDVEANYMIISITSPIFKVELDRITKRFTDYDIFLVGSGIIGYESICNNVKGCYRTYELCLEAING